MYTDFYGLREPPFNVTPDPRFLYLNDCYQEAIAALGYGVDARKGFITLVGEAGTGKTTLLRRVLDSLGHGTRSVLLLNPTVAFDEILELILFELGIPTDSAGKLVRLQRLNEFLIEHTRSGGNVVLLIDEAQDLRPAVLEELRLLSNLETAREKLLQIVLAGQPELDGILGDPALRQLRQRVTLRVRLRPLTSSEVVEYVRARLAQAGAVPPGPFTPEAVERIALASGGVPRVVNVLCDASLMLGLAMGIQPVTAAIVEEASRDFELRTAVPLQPVVTPATAPVAISPPMPVAPAPAPAVEASPPVMPPPAPIAPPPAPVAPTAAPIAPIAPVAAPTSPRPAPSAPPAFVTPVEVAAPRMTPAAPMAPEPVSEQAPEEPAAAEDETPAAPRRTLNVPVAAAAIIIFAVTLHLTERHFPVAEMTSLDAETVAETEPVAIPTAPSVLAAVASPVVPAVALASTPPLPEPRVEAVPVVEAAALIERFRRAFEARDVEQIASLFAADGEENGRLGREAIAAVYRAQLTSFDDVRYELPRLAIVPREGRTEVRAPFVLSYRRLDGSHREVRGEAEWALERRDGLPQIVALNYRVEATPSN